MRRSLPSIVRHASFGVSIDLATGRRWSDINSLRYDLGEGAMAEKRIAIEPGKKSGQPAIRGLRIAVWNVLGWMAAGMDEETILSDDPELKASYFPAVFDYPLHEGRRVAL